MFFHLTKIELIYIIINVDLVASGRMNCIWWATETSILTLGLFHERILKRGDLNAAADFPSSCIPRLTF